MSKYVRLCNSVFDKGQLVKAEDVNSLIDDTRDWYESTFFYTEEQRAQFEANGGSVRGIRDVKTDKLWFDFDTENDPEIARKSAKETVERLKKHGIKESAIQAYFSGNKGYNVVVDLNRELTPLQVQTIAAKVAGDLPGFDSSMYDAPQILRVPGTRHQKSGLYKIPVTLSQLENLNTFGTKIKAKSLDNITHDFVFEQAQPDEEFYKLATISEKPKLEVPTEAPSGEIDWSRKPTNWKPWKWSILQGHFKEGERHQALLVLAATCRGMGYDKEEAYYMCKAAIKKQAALHGQDEFPKSELWNNIVASVYSPLWQGGQYAPKNNLWLQQYCNRLNIKWEKELDAGPQTIADIRDAFKEYVKNIDKNTILTGIPTIDQNVFLSTGANVGIIGAASSGKTSLALNILNNTSKAGVRSVFASLDMARNRMFEKVMYKVTGMNRADLYKTFQDDKEGPHIEKLRQEFGNVNFLAKSGPTVTDLRNYITQCQDESGEKVKLVMVDYFERVNTDISDDTAASKKIANELQDLVNDLDVCLITLVQPNKFALSGGADSPILDYTKIKGSSFIYQSMRVILSLWRPFFNPKDFSKDKFMQMAVLKNDLGELGEMAFGWNGKRGEISELGDEGFETLERWLKEKEETKSQGKKDYEW